MFLELVGQIIPCKTHGIICPTISKKRRTGYALPIKHLVVYYIDLSKMYEATTEKILDEFDNAFFKYPSYEMNPFVNTMKIISEEALDSTESTNHFQACQNEESICEDHLRKSYNFAFQPFMINRYPYETLGFGTYMAFFSYFLLNSPDTQIFLGRKELRQEEQWVRAYQSEVLGNLSSHDVGKMSILELVQILHHNPKENMHFNILQALKSESKCYNDDEVVGFLESDEIPCQKYYFLTQFSPLTYIL